MPAKERHSKRWPPISKQRFCARIRARYVNGSTTLDEIGAAHGLNAGSLPRRGGKAGPAKRHRVPMLCCKNRCGNRSLMARASWRASRTWKESSANPRPVLIRLPGSRSKTPTTRRLSDAGNGLSVCCRRKTVVHLVEFVDEQDARRWILQCLQQWARRKEIQ